VEAMETLEDKARERIYRKDLTVSFKNSQHKYGNYKDFKGC
jgi:hypothetical protein